MAEEPRTNRGRPRFGDPPKPKVIKFSTSLPPDAYERLERYCEDEERDKAWVVKHAVDEWLKKRGYLVPSLLLVATWFHW